MFVFSQNLYVKILLSYMMVLGGAALGIHLGHEGEALIMGLVPLKEETPESFLTPSTHEDTVRRCHL